MFVHHPVPYYLAILLLFLTITFALPANQPSTLPSTSRIFGTPPYLTASFYYPLHPAPSVHLAFSTGIWPPTLPIRPSSIYECMPPPDLLFEPRSYTCKNPLIAKESKTPEEIRRYEEARARMPWGGGRCDADTGLVSESLHWGVWQHNCWDVAGAEKEHKVELAAGLKAQFKNSTMELGDVAKTHIQWNRDALYWRRYVLLQLAQHNYALNSKILVLWEQKNQDLEETNRLVNKWKWTERGRRRELVKREARFWRETMGIRMVGREMEKDVARVFERRMEGGEGEKGDWFGMGDVAVDAGER